jgi:xanthine dehydrogenase small subunit
METRAPLRRPSLTLNGRLIAVDPGSLHTTVLAFARARGLTGAKDVCSEGECGACAVAIVVPDGVGSAYRVANSCLLNLGQVVDHEIYTVESLASQGVLAEAQRAMAAAGGSQCGYCTPGFVISLFVEQYRRGRVGPCEPSALAGNLCRCAAYRPIRDAAASLGPPPSGPFLERLSQPAPAIDAVAVDGFSRPRSVEECVSLLEDPHATIIAGGTDLGVDVNRLGRSPRRMISVDAIAELRELSDTAGRVRIGAGLPLTDIACMWRDAPSAVTEWLALFGSPAIRNRATLGGNLATASPVGDGAPLLLALDASVNIAGAGGRGVIPLSTFFTGRRRSCLRSGEMITSIDIPKPLPRLLRFYKVSKRRSDDISTIAAAMAVDLDASGHVGRARFAFGGVAATPVRVVDAEHAVTGCAWNAAAVNKVQRVLDRTLKPMSDHRGSAAYRLEVSKRLVERFQREQHA